MDLFSKHRFTNGNFKILLLAICWISYGNTIWNEYSLDDEFVVEKPAIQKGISGIPEIVTSTYLQVAGEGLDYRPVPGILLALENQFFGKNPHVSHFISVLFYSLLMLLIFQILNVFFELNKLNPFLPFVITAFYAVHPAHTEVVASIKNRDEIISFLFALLALRYYYNFFSFSDCKLLHAALIFAFMLLSYVTKKVSLPISAIIVLSGFFLGFHKQKKRFYLVSALLLAVSVIYHATTIYIGVDREINFLENPLVSNSDFMIRAGTIFKSLLFYLEFLLCPYPFRFYYGYDMIQLIPLHHPEAIVSGLLHIGLLGLGIFGFLRKQAAGFFILAYLVSIISFSNIFIYAGIVAERILFYPSLWFVAALILMLFNLADFSKPGTFSRAGKIILGLGGSAFVLCCGMTIIRNLQWKNHLTLMSADIRHLKNSAHANFLYAVQLETESQKGNNYIHAQYRAQAKKHYRRVLELAPAYTKACLGLGMIYEYQERNRDSAFYYFHKAHEINPENTVAQFQLAKQLYLKGENAGSEVLLSKLYQKLPSDTLTLFFYAQVLHNQNKSGEALKVNAELLKLAPETYYPYYNEGMIQHMRGDTVWAEKNLEKAVFFGYRGEEVYQILAGYYNAGQQKMKIEELRKAFVK